MECTPDGKPVLGSVASPSVCSLAYSLPLLEVGKEHNAMRRQRRRFLEDVHLPPDTSEYEYTGLQDLEEATSQAYRRFITNSAQSPFVVFTNLPLEDFEKQEDNFPGRADYSLSLQLLILTMPSFPHEVASVDFENLVHDKAKQSGVRRDLLARRATRTDSPDRCKQADCSWIPRNLPAGRTSMWPSVALEVAYSEPRAKVKSDMEYWLNQSDDVQMAISVDIKRPSGNVFITSWKHGVPVQPRTPANPEPEAVQEIKIERGKTDGGPWVTGDDNLTIPFERIMLRNPDASQNEKDFVLTKEDLLEVADDVWYTMDNM